VEAGIQAGLSWFESNLVTVFFTIMGGTFLIGSWRYFLPLFRRASVFENATGRLARRQQSSFPSAVFPGHDRLNKLWQQYTSAYESASVELDGKVLSPIGPEKFFTPSRLMRGYNRSSALALAGVFLALGILGTFLGLVMGLQDLNFNMSDQEQFRASAETLLSGMSTAFWSSIGGIAFSIVWLLTDRWLFQRMRDRIADFFRVVGERWPRTSPEGAAFQSLALQMEQKAILQDLGSDLSQAFRDAIDKSFSEQLSPSLNSIDETLDRVASQVSDRQADVLDEMASAFQERLLESVGTQFDELATVIQDATEWQRRVTQDVGTLFEQVVELSRTNSRLLENSSQAAQEFLGSVDALSESHQRMAKISSDLEAVVRHTSELSAQLEAQTRLFSDANEELREELARHLDQVEDQVTAFADFWEDVHGDLGELSSSLSNNLTEFTKMTEEKLGEVFHRFDSEMSTVVEHLGGTLAELREITEDLSPSVARFEEALEATVEPINQSREDVADLADSIRGLRPLSERLRTASEEAEATRGVLAELSSRMESLNGRLGDGASNVRKGGDEEMETDEAEGEGDEGSGGAFGWFRGGSS